MAEVVLFHHVQGLTEGVREIADQLTAAGHIAHTPDLFEGERPDSIEAGAAFAQGLGDELDRRADAAVADLSPGLVYAGFSLGAEIAQRLTQHRPGARGALLYESCFPLTGEWAFGPWPPGVPVQVHGMDADPFFAFEGDLDSARELVAALGEELAELFLYPGDRHLFADRSLPSYDAGAADLLVRRSVALLDRVDRAEPA